MNDPLDTMTLGDSATLARNAEMNSYAAYGNEEGVTGIVVDTNPYGCQRSTAGFRRRAQENYEILDRRELAGLKYYESEILDNLVQQYRHNLDLLEPSDVFLFGGVFTLELNPYINADQVYLNARQYNSGPFLKT